MRPRSGKFDPHAQGILTSTILSEVFAERARQDAKWGGPAHDDEHSMGDWCRWIDDRVERARDFRGLRDIDERRKALIEIAALATAAVESLDRRRLAGSQS